ncbi:Polygalacturonase [Artemisia annua]|uniref:Polygalacturonase n=1 Tax=Artemisia annua TaxID=35608 RepID=A0A2U1PE04_ARTAN|nr:Polygalacturonase [Artemisia annua]
MKNVKNRIIIDQQYCDQDKPCKEQSSAVKIKDGTTIDKHPKVVRLTLSPSSGCLLLSTVQYVTAASKGQQVNGCLTGLLLTSVPYENATAHQHPFEQPIDTFINTTGRQAEDDQKLHSANSSTKKIYAADEATTAICKTSITEQADKEATTTSARTLYSWDPEEMEAEALGTATAASFSYKKPVDVVFFQFVPIK